MVSAINTKKSKGSRTGAGGGRPRFRGTLTLRILTLNMIAPLVLLIGVLYTGEYRENLISADLETIKAHAQLFSGAISESAIRPAVGAPIPLFAHAETQDVLSPTVSRRIIRRLTEDTDNRARIFDSSGRLIGDSVEMNRPVKTPQPPTSPAQRALANSLRFGMHGVLTLFPTESKLHPYSTINSADIKDHPDAAGALHGKTGGTAWSGDDRGDVILSAATAIRHGRQVMGVVLLTREADDVEDAMVRVRFEVFSAFLVALSVTILLSLYLASTIGRPLRRLAIAAEAIRRSKTRAAADIPDLSARRDEIGELSLALREMTQALWDRMDSIENFAADVAHEIKNPLTSLRSAVETVNRVKSASDRDRLIEIINHDVQRLDRLISDISNASRLDAELSRDEMGVVDLRRLLLQLADIHRAPLSRRTGGMEDGNVVIDGAPLSALVPGNEGRLAQVFENLIANALSFSPRGQPVVVGIHAHDKQIAVTVDDSGPGIPDGKLDAIFDRFYTERPEHEDYGRHSGLGLSIARQIVQAHGGQLYAENRHAPAGDIAGARFVVLLEAV